LAGTSALGSLHAPGPPAAPTTAQSQAALTTVASKRPPLAPPTRAKGHGSGCDTQDAEYSHCDPARLRFDAPPAPRRDGSAGRATASGEYGP
jgi:hypothetical protein